MVFKNHFGLGKASFFAKYIFRFLAVFYFYQLLLFIHLDVVISPYVGFTTFLSDVIFM